MTQVSPNFKQPKAPKAKGRARPEEPLALQCQIPGCHDLATERHHILRRSAGGTDDRANTIDACSPHHLKIHSQPSWAYSMGYLKRRGT